MPDPDILDPTGVPSQVVYNAWDWYQLLAFGTGSSKNGGSGNTPLQGTVSEVSPGVFQTEWNGTGSMVAGVDTYYTNHYDPACGTDPAIDNDFDLAPCLTEAGPWQRIDLNGDKLGGSGAVVPAAATGPIQNTSVDAGSLGWSLGSSSPLPAGTNAVRFVHGARRLGELENARLTFVVTDPVAFQNSLENNEFCLDSTGGDTSDTAAKDNPWRYYEPQHECDFFAATSALIKEAKYVNGEPSSGASLSDGDIVSYRILFVNTSPLTLRDISFTDSPATGGLQLLEPPTPGTPSLCVWPSYDGTLPVGPLYDPGSASANTATWSPPVDLAPGGSVELFMCAEVSGGEFDRIENEAAVSYCQVDPGAGLCPPAEMVTLTSKAGGTISTSISGHVYNDVDGSGDLTSGDAPVEGVEITLYEDVDGDGALTPGVDVLIDTKVSLSDGSYEFGGLDSGLDYVLVQTNLAGWTSTGDADNPGNCGSGNGCDTIGTITVSGGDASRGNDFFDQAPASAVNSISGTVFADDDQDGMYEPPQDVGEGAATVRLYEDLNGNGVVDLGEPLLQSQPTAADGSYEFTVAAAGDFVVAVDATTLPVGSSLTTAGELSVSFSGLGGTSNGNDFGFFGGVGTTGGVCYAVADSVDELVAHDLATMSFVDVGDTFTTLIEAIALQPSTGTLFAANAGVFGTLDQSNGDFTAIGNFGTCQLPVSQGSSVITVDDIDGLSFDPLTGVLWGSEAGDNVLVHIDPATGQIVPDSFGVGASCIQTSGVGAGLDDIAVDPTDGTLYGSVETSPNHTLVTVDKTTGVMTAVNATLGNTGIEDLEGLGFGNDGTLYGTNGDLGGALSDSLFTLDKSTGAATFEFAFPLYSDYESVECLTAGANRILGTVFADLNADGSFDPLAGETGTGGVETRLYLDDGDGVFDAGDTLIQTTITAADGTYDFFLGTDGLFFLDTDVGTYPVGATLTTDNEEQAQFVGMNQVDPGNDFGYVAPSDLTVGKVSSAAGDVVPGDTITYTITVTNDGTVPQTGLRVFDPTPAGAGYLAQTTQATGPVPGAPVLVAQADFDEDCGGSGNDDYPAETGSWTGDWLEINDNDACDGGDVRLEDDLGDPALRVQKELLGVYRTVDLGGYSHATLDLEFRRDDFNSVDDTFTIAVCVDVPAGRCDPADTDPDWVVLEQIGNGQDAAYQSRTYDITPYISSATRIRLLNGANNDKRVYFDNVEVNARATSVVTKDNDPISAFSPLVSGNPADLVVPSDGFELAPGESLIVTYSVAVADPLDPNLTQILNAVTVASDQAFPARAYAVDPISEGGTIGDRVWLDTDGDGVQDVGEPGIANVALELRDGLGNVVATTTTDADGNYLFTGIPPGTYTVDVVDATLPGAPGDVVAAPGTSDPSAPLVITGEEIYTDVDFGYTVPAGEALIGDTVWSDADGDGIQDPGEVGIGGVAVNLKGAGPDGLLGTADDVVVATATTAADGSYLFADVAQGEYLVELDASNFAPGASLDGYAATVGPQSEGGATSAPISVAGGDVVLDADFGYRDPTLATITDRLWLDLDGDGVVGPGEDGIEGVTVDLVDPGDPSDPADDVVVGTAVTLADGTFVFSGVPDGDFVLRVSDTDGVLGGLTGTTTSAADGTLAVTVAGADVVDDSFGYSPAGVVGDSVWSDADGDGIQDPGELGIAGVTVELRDALGSPIDSDPLTPGVQPTVTTTAADGSYSFSGVEPGTYSVVVSNAGGVLAGYTQTGDPDATLDGVGTAVVTETGGDLTMDFGYQNTGLADVSGNVFDDLDADGVDDGVFEGGLAGVTVELRDGSGNVVATTVTDANGDYVFADVPDGSYTVAVTDVAGVLDGYRLTSGLDSVPVTVSGADVAGVDFGYVRDAGTASIGDSVWLDLNADGVESGGEPGIGGVTVELWEDTDGNGALDPAFDMLIATTVTDANGGYRFAGLDAGRYFTRVDGSTLPGGTPSGALVRTNGTGDVSQLIGLSEGEVFTEADLGYGSAGGVGAIGDRIWSDADGDGIQDPGEPGIGGVTVELYDVLGNLVATTITAPDGTYLFTDLSPAPEYAVVVDTATLPAAYGPVPTNTPGGRTTLDPPAVAGEVTVWADFGFSGPTASIGDSVFLDQDGDGVRDAGEPGLSGVTINLIDDATGAVVATTTTAADGSYDFVGLPAGSYSVEITDVAGVLDGLNPSTSAAPLTNISLAAGQDYDLADAGFSPADPVTAVGSIGSLVWNDLDADGVRDPGEDGLEGVTLELWLDVDADGTITPGIDNLVRTTSTDSNGEYELTGLVPGEYLVEVTDEKGILAGMTQTLGTPGLDDNGQSDPYAVTLTPASPSDDTADFSYAAAVPVDVSGTVYFDLVGNGTMDGLDTGIGGVTVSLVHDPDGDGVFTIYATTTTAPDGSYVFVDVAASGDDLAPFEYVVQVDTTGTFLAGSIETEPGTLAHVISLGTTDSIDNDFGYTKAATLVLVSEVRSFWSRGEVVVEIETASQIGSIGFWLWRLDAETGDWLQVNDDIVPALEAPQGATYRIVDPGADLESNVYMLYEAEMLGGEKVYGPFETTVEDRDSWDDGLASKARPVQEAYLARARVAERERRAARREAAANMLPTVSSAARTGASVAVTVERAGVQFLTARQISDAMGSREGVAEAYIKTGKLVLSRDGVAVPWWPATGSSGIFFYDPGVDSIYTQTAIYRLEGGKAGAAAPRRSALDGGAPAPGAVKIHPSRQDFEQDVFAGTVVGTDPDSDFWFWAGLVGGHANGRRSFTLDVEHPAVGAGSARLDVRLYGASSTAAPFDHEVDVSLNGVTLGTTSWDGVGAHTATFALPSSLLVAGDNDLFLQANRPAAAPFSYVYVDGFELAYARESRAVSDRATVPAQRDEQITVTGFSSPDVEVFRRSPSDLRRLANLTIEGDGSGGYLVSFVSPAAGDYEIVSTAGLESADAEAWTDLSVDPIGAEYVVVAPRQLLSGARRLADHRASRGLTTEVVELETLHLDYGHGLPTPEAIREFLVEAWTTWHRRPRFLVLLGKGTFDYKGVQGLGGNLMPPLLTATPTGLYASDARFGDVIGGDGVPEIAVGRIPVITQSQLDAYVDKLIAYEQAGSAPGSDKVVLLADDADGGGNFAAASGAAASWVPSGYRTRSIHLGALTTAGARQQLFDELQEGALLLNYFGHGGLDRLADEPLLTSADVAALDNGDGLPVMTALTCSIGRYEVPGFVSLAEELVLAADRGAIAVWAPSGTSLNDDASVLSDGFMEAVFAAGVGTVGEAVLHSLRTYGAAGGNFDFVPAVYNLIGDPAVAMP